MVYQYGPEFTGAGNGAAVFAGGLLHPKGAWCICRRAHAEMGKRSYIATLCQIMTRMSGYWFIASLSAVQGPEWKSITPGLVNSSLG